MKTKRSYILILTCLAACQIGDPFSHTPRNLTEMKPSHPVERRLLPSTSQTFELTGLFHPKKKSTFVLAYNQNFNQYSLQTETQSYNLSGLSSESQSEFLKPIVQDLFASICQDLKSDQNQNESHTTQLYCHLKDQDQDSLLSKVEDLKINMIRSWQRQPYLFARRLAFLENLLRAHDSPSSICRLLDLTHPDEIPLILTSSWFKESACQNQPISSIWLQLALAELQDLAQYIEQKSSLKHLKILLPDSPQLDEKVIVSMSLHPENIDLKTGMIPCWMGLLNLSMWQMEYVSSHLNLTPEPCHIINDQTHQAQKIHDYIRTSIMGETTFIVKVGQSKRLRLPIGSYSVDVTTVDNKKDGNDLIRLSTEINWDATNKAQIITLQPQPQLATTSSLKTS